MNARILIVDDDDNALRGFSRNLRSDFDVTLERQPEQALRLMQSSEPFAAVLSDYRMPRMDGVNFLSKVKEVAPDCVRLMVTGFADLENTIKAVNEGSIFRFFTKPCPLMELKKGLNDALRQHELIISERELLNKTLKGSVQTLLEILSITNSYAFALAKKRRLLAKSTAEQLGSRETWSIEMAAMLCEIGIVSWPDEVVASYRSGKSLNVAQREMVKQLPSASAKLLEKIPRLEAVREAILQQRLEFRPQKPEELSPNTPTGKAISLGARILKALNDFFHLTENGQCLTQTLDLLEHNKIAYDPTVIVALRRVVPQQGNDSGSRRKTKSITLSNLIEGHILRSDVRALSGDLILRSGQTLGQLHIQRLRNFACSIGIQEPFLIEDPFSRN